MKKFFAVLLALVLALSMSTVAFAAGTGTITISNAFPGAKYDIYKMFDFTPIAEGSTQGRYTVVDAWVDFMADNEWLKYDSAAGTVVLKEGKTNSDLPDLAKAAVAYAVENNIAPTATQTVATNAEEPATVTFSNVALGYYAIDTSLGTICALTNADDTFEAHEKNTKPSITKEVQEDADNSWGKVNDADIDQEVNFRSTITIGAGVTNYVMHDTMEAGLTFKNNVVVTDKNGAVDASNYTVVYPATDGHTFDVEFKNEYISTLEQGDTLTVTYSATLNENANVATDGNDNTVVLKYGEDSTWESTTEKTTTYTWKMDVFKVDAADQNALSGAKFQLKKGDDVIKFTEVTGTSVPTYKVDVEGSVTEIITDATGKFEILGLDEGTYSLVETEAPEGYNKLKDDYEVVIASTHDDANLTASYTINGSDPATIKVENKTGSLLPETGGIGTTIFYVVGISLMLGAVILLITKKKKTA